MESKSIWSVAMLGMLGLVACGVLAFINMGYVEREQRSNPNVLFGKFSAQFAQNFGERLKIEEADATLTGSLAEIRYTTHRYLSFSPEELDKEFAELGKYAQENLPNSGEVKELLLIRVEITGGGCRRQTRQSTKLFPVVYKKPVIRPGETPHFEEKK